jgi:hypothetical protein
MTWGEADGERWGVKSAPRVAVGRKRREESGRTHDGLCRGCNLCRERTRRFWELGPCVGVGHFQKRCRAERRACSHGHGERMTRLDRTDMAPRSASPPMACSLMHVRCATVRTVGGPLTSNNSFYSLSLSTTCCSVLTGSCSAPKENRAHSAYPRPAPAARHSSRW